MATSSLCAPVFTKEDAEKEEKSLSKEERRKIDEDAYGSFSDNDESIDTNDVDIAKENFERALERIVDKGEYQEAVRGCPEVVAAESRPVFFLRSTDFNAEVSNGTHCTLLLLSLLCSCLTFLFPVCRGSSCSVLEVAHADLWEQGCSSSAPTGNARRLVDAQLMLPDAVTSGS